MDYGNEISELLAEGWSYKDAAEWYAFVVVADEDCTLEDC